MLAITEIPGIGTNSQKLLDAAGIRDTAHLAGQNADDLVIKLQSANDVFSLSKRSPGLSTVKKWIQAAKDLTEIKPPELAIKSQQISGAVNYEANPEVAAMLDQAPCAIPMPGKMMMESGLGVADIPAGILLNRYSGDLDVKIAEPPKSRADVPGRRSAAPIEARSTKGHSEPSAIVPNTPFPESRIERTPTSKEGHEHDRVALLRAPLEKTNRGKDPNSRRYVRGVLHTHPWSLRIGAVLTLLLTIDLPLAAVSAFLLLFSQEVPESFSWVPKWILTFPLALPVIGFGYLIFGFTGKCRICNQKLFTPKGALKHIKAHRLPGAGFVIPLAIHLLMFSWFRCSSCGTPVRMRK